MLPLIVLCNQKVACQGPVEVFLKIRCALQDCVNVELFMPISAFYKLDFMPGFYLELITII